MKDELPKDENGNEFILRSICCYSKIYTVDLICGECRKHNVEIVKFIKDKNYDVQIPTQN